MKPTKPTTENEPDYPHEKIKADIRIIREILGWIE